VEIIKMIKRLAIILSIALIFIFMGCKPEPDLGTAPKILDAGFFPPDQYDVPRIVILTEGVTYDFILLMEDPDLDASSCQVTETGPAGYYFAGEFPLASQPSSSCIYLAGRGAPEPPYGAYQISLTLEDAEGNTSNTFIVNYSIVAP
jgi:hypothetical protein